MLASSERDSKPGLVMWYSCGCFGDSAVQIQVRLVQVRDARHRCRRGLVVLQSSVAAHGMPEMVTTWEVVFEENWRIGRSAEVKGKVCCLDRSAAASVQSRECGRGTN